MATLFRNNATKRLVFLSHVTPPKYTGGWYVEIDFFTGIEKKCSNKAVSRLGHNIKINPAHYTKVATL